MYVLRLFAKIFRRSCHQSNISFQRISPAGKRYNSRKVIQLKKIWALCEKHAKLWHNFNGKLAKTAFHLPRERMQLKVPSKKTKVFFDFEANSVGVLAKYSARLREIHSSSPGEPIEEQFVFWRKKIFLNIFKLRA